MIYPRSFTNVCFQTRIEFLNVVKCRWGSRGAVSYTTGYDGALVWVHGSKTTENFGLFTSGGQINGLK